jgi:maltose-binding protein MalE
MKKFLMLAVMAAGCTLSAVAQVSPSPSDQTGAPSAQENPRSGSMTVEGCLGGFAGTYTLHDKAGGIYNLTGDTSKLAAHVGQEVRITGSANAASSATSTAGSAGTTASNGTSNAFQNLHVSSLTKVSGSCSSSR